MKVLHVIGSLEEGGAEAVLYNLICQTPHIRHFVVTLVAGGKYVSLLRSDGIEVCSLDIRKNPLSLMNAVKTLRSIITDFRPHAVQSWMYHAGVISAFACGSRISARLFLGVHNTAVDSHRNKLPTYASIRLLARLSRSYSSVIYCSKSARDAHEAIGYPREKTVVITNGISTERFKPCSRLRQKIRDRLGVDASSHLFGMVARVHPQKNYRGLIEALKIVREGTLSPFKIVLAGRGTDTDAALQQWILDSNLRDVVIALGPRDDIPAIMTAIDTLVLPSEFGEAFPMVLCEAMSCGTPCIATDVGDSANIIGDLGIIVAPGDPEALAGAMINRIEFGLEPEGFDTKTRTHAIQTFSIGAMALAYEAAWAE
jgi:glycosyltransferase involved in cell wall biosynthesis